MRGSHSKYVPAPVHAANRLGPSIPEGEVLIPVAALELWEMAMRQAERSPQRRFRTGAVLFDPRSGRLLSKACSRCAPGQMQEVATLHAEADAIRKARHVDLEGAHALVVCVNANSSGWAWSACPCRSCAAQLDHAGIAEVHFAQRDSEGEWMVFSVSPQSLIRRAENPKGREARHQKIWVA